MFSQSSYTIVLIHVINSYCFSKGLFYTKISIIFFVYPQSGSAGKTWHMLRIIIQFLQRVVIVPIALESFLCFCVCIVLS